MKVSAWFMVVLAIVLGIYAYKLTKEAATPAPAEPQTIVQTVPAPEAPYQAVIAVKPIVPELPIPADAVSLKPVWVMPAGGFERIDALAGRIPTQPIDVGEPVLEKHFLVGSVLSQKLEPGQRAVALQISEETGVGGYPQPGDFVDVLLFLPDDKENENSQARLLLERVKVLAMGTQVSGPQGQGKPNQSARTAVLSVPEAKALELMLGASAGEIRLSLHAAKEAEQLAMAAPVGEAAAEPKPPAAGEGKPAPAAAEPQVLTLKEFAEVPKTATQKPANRVAATPRVVIYRGGQRETVPCCR
ncbi:Flp pilus assembly protein CpaB [Thioalbus denitrificans]|uniref:Pilus assembly protein CpaB n=1 Tax=Thioalbus denitrificans TaxID=547122 RepID=A0A369CAV6_9GAMM|nr:Flp pilus assembly protein CpaB [Thioalbus denitrificans]RCX29777.1 pilus assembly protein CpaB [Thioalbus denitrificans]